MKGRWNGTSHSTADRGCQRVLTADLARSRTRDGTVSPLFIDLDDQQYRETARELIRSSKTISANPKAS